MKRYSVRTEILIVDRRDVDAESEEEAKALANEAICDAGLWPDEILDCCVMDEEELEDTRDEYLDSVNLDSLGTEDR